MVPEPAQPARGPDAVESPEPSSEQCGNCGAVLTGPFCAQCGQAHHELRPSFGHLFEEIVEEIAHVDAKLPKTLWLLVSRPGFLSREYFAGRRARYIGPFKIYILCSVVFFLGLAVTRWAENPPAPKPVPAATRTTGKPSGKTKTGGSKAPDLTWKMKNRGVDASMRVRFAKAEPKSGVSRLLWRVLEPEIANTTPREIGNHIAHGIFAYMPDAMLVLLPIFALILRALYWRRYYVEHFVFALHLHAVGYLALLADTLAVFVPALPLLMFVALTVYFLIAFRRFYEQGWAKTVLKLGAAMFVYLTLIGFTVAAVAIAGVVFSA